MDLVNIYAQESTTESGEVQSLQLFAALEQQSAKALRNGDVTTTAETAIEAINTVDSDLQSFAKSVGVNTEAINNTGTKRNKTGKSGDLTDWLLMLIAFFLFLIICFKC